MLESNFKRRVKIRIKSLIPECFMHEMKAGASGVPDTLILYGERWALLEFKNSSTAHHQPNQDYYVNYFNSMGFSAFIYPENEDEVIDKLILYFRGD